MISRCWASGSCSFVLLQDAFDAALLGGGDPLQNVFFRLIALFQVDPVGVVVLVCCPFSVDGLLDDLLRGLCVQPREREREYPGPEKARLFFAHFVDCLCRSKVTAL